MANMTHHEADVARSVTNTMYGVDDLTNSAGN